MTTELPRIILRPIGDGGPDSSYEVILGAEQIGFVRLQPDGADSLRVTGKLDPRHAGRGFGTAAIGLACGLARERPGIVRVVATADVAEGAMQRVLEKNGFVCADVSRRNLHFELLLDDTRSTP